MENREKVLKKIENLLALAGNNPSENEALAAALKAQELMAKYNIELAEVEGQDKSEEIVKEEYAPKANCHYVRKWRYTLANIIARNFCCKTYVVNRETTVFYGYAKDAKIAVEVFKFLLKLETSSPIATILNARKKALKPKAFLIHICWASATALKRYLINSAPLL